MELREFISAALLDIIGAVQDAQSKAPAGSIVPENVNTGVEAAKAGFTKYQSVEFEVTVRAEGRSAKEAKLNVVAAVVGGGVASGSAKSDGHAATLKFRIPLQLPSSTSIKCQ